MLPLLFSIVADLDKLSNFSVAFTSLFLAWLPETQSLISTVKSMSSENLRIDFNALYKAVPPLKYAYPCFSQCVNSFKSNVT